MDWLKGWSKQLRTLLRKREVEGELDEELAFHIEMETAKNLREGMRPEEARRAALLAFGGVERWKEEVRDARWVRVLEDLAADGRYALRSLRRAPAFALAVVLTLALGIGANTTIFSAANSLVLRALPFPDRDRLVEVRHVRRNGEQWEQTSAANFLALREGSPGFQGLAAYAWWSAHLTRAGRGERLVAFRATPDFFSLLGARPLIGRTFAPDEGAAGRNRVAVIGERLWKRRFGGDPAVLGATVVLDGDAYTVVGVMPARVAFPAEADLWAPMAFDASWRQSVSVVGRVRAGTATERVQDEASALIRRLAREEPGRHTGAGVVLRPLYWEQAEYLRTFLTLLATAVAFVLLVACANVANLLLARASTRGRELAIRAALGASRGRIFRQLLVESVLLALLGGALGVVLAVAAISGLRRAVPGTLSRFMSGWDGIAVDARVLGFTLAVSVAAGVLFGLAPALGASRPSRALPGGERGAATARGGRLRRVLVASEVALAVVLLVGAGLVTRSFMQLLRAEPGFRTERVLTADLSLAPSAHPAGAPPARVYDRLVERVRTLPGVRVAGVVSYLPMSRTGSGLTFTVRGRPVGPGGEQLWAQRRSVTPGYLDALGIPLRRGRGFTGADGAGAPPVVLVNETLARRYFGGAAPLGQRIELWGETREIVGVVGDVHHQGLDEPPAPELYLPQAQAPTAMAFLVVRTAGDPAGIAAAVRREIGALGPGVASTGVRSMEAVVAEFAAPERLLAGMLAAFAVAALLIAVVGIYGVTVYTVAQRTYEVGVRAALGAGPRDVLRMLMGQGVMLTAAGMAAGLVASLALTRFLRGVLYGVSTLDPLTYAAVALLLGTVSAVAIYAPARRATRANLMSILRGD